MKKRVTKYTDQRLYTTTIPNWETADLVLSMRAAAARKTSDLGSTATFDSTAGRSTMPSKVLYILQSVSTNQTPRTAMPRGLTERELGKLGSMFPRQSCRLFSREQISKTGSTCVLYNAITKQSSRSSGRGRAERP